MRAGNSFKHILTALIAVLVLGHFVLAGTYLTVRHYSYLLSENTEKITAVVFSKTGFQLDIQNLAVSWHGLNPLIAVEKLALQPGNGEQFDPAWQQQDIDTSLSASRVSVYIDLLATVLQRELRLYALQADNIRIAVEQNADGQWSLAGQPPSPAGRGFDGLDFINHLHLLDIQQLAVAAITDSAGKSSSVTILPQFRASLRRDNDQRQLLLQDVSANGATFSIAVESSGNLLDDQSRLDAHVVSSGHGISQWINLFADEWQLDALHAELWASKPQLQPARIKVQISDTAIRQTTAAQVKPENVFKNIAVLTDLLWAPENHLNAAWSDLSVTFRERDLQLADGELSLSLEPGKSSDIALTVDDIELSPLAEVLLSLDLLSDKHAAIVADLNPRGSLSGVSLIFAKEQPGGMQLQANLRNVAVQPWRGAPGGESISGRLVVSASDGYVELDSAEPFSMYFPDIYREPFIFNEASGKVSWEIGEERFFVRGDKLNLSADGGAIYGGDFEVNGGMKKGGAASQMRLEIGVNTARIEDLLKYVPYTVSERLIDWIASSGASGDVVDGGFIFNGSLRKSEDRYRNIQMFFNIEDTSLTFDSGWPRIDSVQGLLLVSPSVSQMTARHAMLNNLSLNDARIDVYTSKQTNYVDVNAAVGGEVKDVLHLLREASPTRHLNAYIGDWRGSGVVKDGQLQLRAPLVEEAAVNTQVDFAGYLSEAELQMQNLDLVLQQLHGPIAYSSERGLFSEQLDALLWSKPVSIQIGNYADDQQQAASNLRIDAAMSANAESIHQWLQQPLFGFASGEADFSLTLEHIQGASQLNIQSDLQGVAIRTPVPIYKQANTRLPLSLNWRISDAEQPLSLRLADTLEAKLAFNNFSLQGATIHLLEQKDDSLLHDKTVSQLEELSLYQAGQLTLSGTLELFNWTEWQQVIAQYTQYLDLFPDNDAGALLLAGNSLAINELILFDNQLQDLIVSFAEGDQAWTFDVESEMLKGKITFPLNFLEDDTEKTPATVVAADSDLPQIPDFVGVDERMLVDLDYLRLPSLERGIDSQRAVEIKKNLLDPADLQAMKVDINQLYFGQKSYGQWHFLLTSSSNTALIHNIRAVYSSLALRSDHDDGLLWAMDQSGDFESSLDLQITSEKFDIFLKSIARDENNLPLSAEQANIDLSLNWPAAPDQFSPEKLHGYIGFDLGEGRFFQASESATGVLKLIGLINFDTIVRKMQLDFSDVYKQGLRFDSIDGKVTLAEKHIDFSATPIRVEAPSSKFSLSGSADFNQSTIDAELVATMPIANNLPWLAALAGGLPVAAGTFIVTKVFDTQLDQFSSAVYEVSGDINNPQVRFKQLFEGKASSASAEAK